MTDFEKGVYSDMSVTDRILILTIKVNEVIEFGNLMTKLGDGPEVKAVLTALQNSRKEKNHAQ